ncbi:MAG TPA: phosphomannomutase/phosphoglucomutase [Thermomicrobiales bacterium]|nr:phosphomannomutase/phosphoglucomutase [Thermomicrobiales bacterium]
MVDPAIFKAYDVRGVYPGELDAAVAERIGRAFVAFLGADRVAVGRDMRRSGQALARALMRGIAAQGADLVDLGLTSTDELYFAVGKFGYPAGAMVTASHNPPEYNGLKLCRADAIPLSEDTGITQIRDMVVNDQIPAASRRGQITTRDVLQDYVAHALGFIDVGALQPLTVVADAGNGMAGMILPTVFDHLPCRLIPLYFELDGSFPNHPANPIEPENIVDLQAKVRETGADLGVAFDGDADRMFLVDERGTFIGGDMVTALVARSLLQKHPGATIVYNLICSRSVPETIARNGGRAVRERVGHSFIKATMRREDAIFGGEHSGHFYFRDNWYADSGLIAFLTVLELLSAADAPLSRVLAPLDPYVRSGEINSEVGDIAAVLARVEAHERAAGATIDTLDGLTVNFPDWWFNLRPSNTQPLLRLNVEASDPAQLKAKTDEVLALVRSDE